MSAPFGNQELRNLPKLRAIVTSHSIDGTFESCERRFEFMHVWQQSPEGGTTGFAAEVGTALHEAIQAWARLALFPGRDRHAKNPIAIRAGLYALMRFWPWSLETVSLQMSKAGIKQRSLGEAILLFEQVIKMNSGNRGNLSTSGVSTYLLRYPGESIMPALALFLFQRVKWGSSLPKVKSISFLGIVIPGRYESLTSKRL
jgi:hypothetical protein